MEIKSFIVGMETDTGVKKEINQDAMLHLVARSHRGPIVLGCLCDGAGGLKMGEMASSYVVSAMDKWFRNELKEIVKRADYMEAAGKDIIDLISDCNNEIYEHSQKIGGMIGTTVVCFLAIGDEFLCVHVGDSRLYRVRPDSLKQLTEDHSYVQSLINQKQLTKEEAKKDKRRSALLRCVGADVTVQPDICYGTIEEDDGFLLCCDGFWHELSDEELMMGLGCELNDKEMIKKRLRQMIDIVLKRKEQDNISAMFVRTIVM